MAHIRQYLNHTLAMDPEFLSGLNDKKDVAIQLDNITMEDDYEGNFDTRRALVYTLRFTAKTYLYIITPCHFIRAIRLTI